MIKDIFKKCFLILPALIVMNACEDPQQEVFDAIREETIANSTSDELIRVLTAGAYTPLIGNWGGHNSLYALHEVSSDEMVITQKGADWEDGGQWIRVHRQAYLPTEQSVNNGWGYCYSAIASTNILLLQYPDLENLQAELKVLRALNYLWLLDAYGNVPIITESDTDPAPPSDTRQDVFDFVEQSILDNMDKLPKEATYASMNYYVAQAMLAKLYINSEVYTGTPQWQKVVDAVDEIEESGLYSLEANYFSAFSTNNRNSSENIFVIPYDANNATGFNMPQMTLHYESQKTFDLQQQPWNGYSTLEEFYNMYEANDARINSFLVGPQFSLSGERLIDLSAEPTDPDGPPLTFTPEINMLAPNAFRQAGARVGKFEFQIGAGPDLSNDFPIFRLGDMLLLKAEALWRMNPGSTEALDIVNMQIRDRVGADPLPSLTADNLLAERGKEMFAEGYRRQDLIRFGKFTDPWWEKPATAATKTIFPIPQAQIDVNNNLTQNPGY
jgi:hypothetical protein